MREIVKANGQPYMKVTLKENILTLYMCQGSWSGCTLEIHAKFIPQLRQLLVEAEFLKTL